MSTIWKLVLGIVVIAGVVFAIRAMSNPNPQTSSSATQASETTQSNVAPADTSNSGLEQDMVSIDGQIKTVDQNSASTDQSFSDTPVQQTE